MEPENLMASLEKFQEDNSSKAYKCELLMCFWFAIHTGNFVICQKLYDLDVIIQNVLTNLRKNGKFYIDIKRNLEQKDNTRKSVVMEEEVQAEIGNSMNETQKDDLEAERISLIKSPLHP